MAATTPQRMEHPGESQSGKALVATIGETVGAGQRPRTLWEVLEGLAQCGKSLAWSESLAEHFVEALEVANVLRSYCVRIRRVRQSIVIDTQIDRPMKTWSRRSSKSDIPTFSNSFHGEDHPDSSSDSTGNRGGCF